MRLRVRARFIAFVCLLLGLSGKAAPAGLGVFYNGSFDLPIPADTSATRGWMDDAVIEVPDHHTIVDLDVAVSLTHANVFDLQLLLTSPSGTTVVLNMYDPFSEYFEGADYCNTIFDDEALISIRDGAAPFEGRFRPLDPAGLAAFDGEDAFGLWRLRIYDAYYMDTGSLESFGLIITTMSDIATVPAPAPTATVLVLLGLGCLRWVRRFRAAQADSDASFWRTICSCRLRNSASLRRSSASCRARICTARMAAFLAPALPTAIVATGTPGGI